MDNVHASLRPLLEYVEDTYIGRMHRGVRRDPMFPLSWWNVYDRTLAGDPRTNNAAEGGHYRLQQDLDVDHPSIWVFIKKLKQVQKMRDVVYNQAEGGTAPPLKKKKYRLLDDRLQGLVVDYETRTSIEYLRAVAHNLGKQ